jgi:hypothetical protein
LLPTRSYVIKRIGISALARWGFAAGALVACFPAFGCSAIFFFITAAVHRIAEGWRDVGLTVLGQRLSLDFIQLLHLNSFAEALSSINGLGVLGILLLALVLALAMGVVVALSFVLLGVFYNLTGHLELELAEK